MTEEKLALILDAKNKLSKAQDDLGKLNLLSNPFYEGDNGSALTKDEVLKIDKIFNKAKNKALKIVKQRLKISLENFEKY